MKICTFMILMINISALDGCQCHWIGTLIVFYEMNLQYSEWRYVVVVYLISILLLVKLVKSFYVDFLYEDFFRTIHCIDFKSNEHVAFFKHSNIKL